MSDIRVVTRQNNYTAVDDNEFIAPRANRLGDLVSQDMYQQMVWDGRCFMASNAARETALAVGGTSFSDTAPAFLLDVPSGTTAVPPGDGAEAGRHGGRGG